MKIFEKGLNLSQLQFLPMRLNKAVKTMDLRRKLMQLSILNLQRCFRTVVIILSQILLCKLKTNLKTTEQKKRNNKKNSWKKTSKQWGMNCKEPKMWSIVQRIKPQSQLPFQCQRDQLILPLSGNAMLTICHSNQLLSFSLMRLKDLRKIRQKEFTSFSVSLILEQGTWQTRESIEIKKTHLCSLALIWLNSHIMKQT